MTVEPGCYFVPSEIDRALADPAMVPPPRTKWTRRVPHPVLIGHVASLTPYRALADPAMVFPAPFSPLGPPHYGRRPRARCPGAQRGGPERKRGDALL